MKRSTFISNLGKTGIALYLPRIKYAMAQEPTQLFFEDDGKIPNNKFPLILYRNAFADRDGRGASWLEKKFASNNWTNSWRNGIYSFHHYHSTSHEVLGIYAGNALVDCNTYMGSINWSYFVPDRRNKTAHSQAT